MNKLSKDGFDHLKLWCNIYAEMRGIPDTKEARDSMQVWHLKRFGGQRMLSENKFIECLRLEEDEDNIDYQYREVKEAILQLIEANGMDMSAVNSYLKGEQYKLLILNAGGIL